MIRIRRSAERGHFDHGWLDTRHTFSFADYQDPAHMGFRSLRVINEDRVRPGGGFPTHGHRDMEIVTYVVEGALRHRDSLGNGSVIRPGEVQRMSAGAGVRHSETNDSPTDPVHFLQIWILPWTPGGPATYEQKEFRAAGGRGGLRLVVSPDGGEGSLSIQRDVRIHRGSLEAGDSVAHALAPGRHAWLQVVDGAVSLNGHDLESGDGAAASEERSLAIRAARPCEFLLFDLD